MTAVSRTTTLPGARVVGDSWTMCWRLLKAMPRVPELLVFSTIQPIMFVLLFRYVFGGAIDTGSIPYVQFLMPGIFVQTLAFNGAATGIGMADDMSKGIVDRFRSLPISPAAMEIGRSISDLIRAAFIFVVLALVGIATGYRFYGSVGGIIGGIALTLAFSYALSWVGIFIGLSVKSVEAAQSGGFIWLFPLTFASSAFVPVSSMPGWLQSFAEHNPVTVVVNATRALFDPAAGAASNVNLAWSIWQSVFWIAGILAVFVPLCVLKFRRMSR